MINKIFLAVTIVINAVFQSFLHCFILPSFTNGNNIVNTNVISIVATIVIGILSIVALIILFNKTLNFNEQKRLHLGYSFLLIGIAVSAIFEMMATYVPLVSGTPEIGTLIFWILQLSLLIILTLYYIFMDKFTTETPISFIILLVATFIVYFVYHFTVLANVNVDFINNSQSINLPKLVIFYITIILAFLADVTESILAIKKH